MLSVSSLFPVRFYAGNFHKSGSPNCSPSFTANLNFTDGRLRSTTVGNVYIWNAGGKIKSALFRLCNYLLHIITIYIYSGRDKGRTETAIPQKPIIYFYNSHTQNKKDFLRRILEERQFKPGIDLTFEHKRRTKLPESNPNSSDNPQ